MTDSKNTTAKKEKEARSFVDLFGKEYNADILDEAPVKSFADVLGDKYNADDLDDGPFTTELLSVEWIDDKGNRIIKKIKK